MTASIAPAVPRVVVGRERYGDMSVRKEPPVRTLDRGTILAYRRRVGTLDVRLPPGARSLRTVASAGLQDSMPRAALLSIHARVEGTTPTTLGDPGLVQVWGPRYSVFVVPEGDVAPFTVGRMPDRPDQVQRAHDTADRIAAYLGDEQASVTDIARGTGIHPNALRYATTTGRVRIRWEGARRPTLWVTDPPDVDPDTARAELARRYVRTFGPVTSGSFARWAGIHPRLADAAFAAIAEELIPVGTPIGEAAILADAVDLFDGDRADPAPARLLPSGDAFYLYWDDDRALVVPDAERRAYLWTSRVWPGAVLADGEIVGTWRRARHRVTVRPWVPLAAARRSAIEREAEGLPLPGIDRPLDVVWET